MKSKNLELLEEILTENSIDIGKIEGRSKTGSFPIFKEDDQELEDLVESAMRENLRETIQESDISDADKVKHLLALEDINFKDEQKEKFIYNRIDPIIEAAGIVDFIGDNPQSVPVVVYETAMALQMAKDGDYDSIVDIMEMVDSIETENISLQEAELQGKRKKEEEDDEEDYDENYEDEEDSGEDEEDEKSSKKKVKEDYTPQEKKEILDSYIGKIFEDWEISEDPRQIRLVLENAENYLETYGYHNLVPDVFELAEMNLNPLNEAVPIPIKWSGKLARKVGGSMKSGLYRSAKRMGVQTTGSAGWGNTLHNVGTKDVAKGVAKKVAPIAGGVGVVGGGSALAIKNAQNKGAEIARQQTAEVVPPASLAARVRGAVSNTLSSLGSAGKSVANRIRNMSTGTKFALGAALLGLIGTLAYRKFVSSGSDKQEAARKTIATLQAQVKNCAGASNPEKCRAAANAQINKWKQRAA